MPSLNLLGQRVWLPFGDIQEYRIRGPVIYSCTRNPSPSATTGEAAGGKLASLAHTPPTLALLANTPTARFARPHLTRSSLRSPPPCRSDPRLRPQTALNGLGGRIEVTASNDLGGRIEAAASNGLKVGP